MSNGQGGTRDVVGRLECPTPQASRDRKFNIPCMEVGWGSYATITNTSFVGNVFEGELLAVGPSSTVLSGCKFLRNCASAVLSSFSSKLTMQGG